MESTYMTISLCFAQLKQVINLFKNLTKFNTEPKAVTGKQILEFFDQGGNVLIAGDIDASRIYRNVLNNFGVEMDLIVIKFSHFKNLIRGHKFTMISITWIH